MLEWLTGFSGPADARDAGTDEGQTYLETLPETPAPLFAVRAFKTAIFGTPLPEQRGSRRPAQPLEPAEISSDHAQAEKLKDVEKYSPPSKEDVSVPKPDLFSSPAKGILMTPGITATRRKTVSFLHIEDSTPEEFKDASINDVEAGIDAALTPPKKDADQPRQPKLTKTLIELSKKQSEKKCGLDDLNRRASKSADGIVLPAPTGSLQASPDTTVDLSQPRSRSGQHWKTEYEEYHRKSTREMKRIIRYDQNVKSYAAKKDYEATSLGEKLERELAKVAQMEKKMTRLAAQLSATQSQGPERESDQTRLVSKLAQQTALAIRYKQKADQYKAAIQQQTSRNDGGDNQGEFQSAADELRWSRRSAVRPDATDDHQDMARLEAQLDDSRKSCKVAEDHAKKLETENAALKRNLARVKEEIMSYETRRQAREERLKEREAMHKAAKEECDKRLAQLNTKYKELLRQTKRKPAADQAVYLQTNHVKQSTQKLDGNRKLAAIAPKEDDAQNAWPLHHEASDSKISSISPRKRRLQNTAIDIWTLSSPNDAAIEKTPVKEPTELPPSSVKHDIHRTLKEINQNLVVEKQPLDNLNREDAPHKAKFSPKAPATDNVQAPMPTTVRGIPDHRSSLDSQRPSMISLASSPAELQPSQPNDLIYTNPSVTTMGRLASLKTATVGSRTSTMGSVRGSLPADRAAAAKARLAKRSAEKRRRQASA